MSNDLNEDHRTTERTLLPLAPESLCVWLAYGAWSDAGAGEPSATSSKASLLGASEPKSQAFRTTWPRLRPRSGALGLQVHAAGLEDEGGEDHDEVEQPRGHGALHEVQAVVPQGIAFFPGEPKAHFCPSHFCPRRRWNMRISNDFEAMSSDLRPIDLEARADQPAAQQRLARALNCLGNRTMVWTMARITVENSLVSRPVACRSRFKLNLTDHTDLL